MKISAMSEYMSLAAGRPIRARVALAPFRARNEAQGTRSSTHAIPVSTQTSICA
jgi:hypothetical protein